MNKHIKSYLTVVGIKMIEKMIISTATKISEKSGMKVEDIKDDLTPAFKIKGEKNLFFDVNAIRTHISDKKLSLSDITIVIVRAIDEKMEKNKLRRVDNSEIKGQFKLDPVALTDEANFILFQKDKIQLNLDTSDIEENERLNREARDTLSSIIQDSTPVSGEQEIEVTIDENEHSVSGSNVTLDDLSNIEVEDVPNNSNMNVEESNGNEIPKKGLVSSVNDTTKRAIGKMSSEISDYIDIVDNMKRGAKIRLIAEKCDMSRDWMMELEQDSLSDSGNQHYRRQTNQNVKIEDTTLELLHIYQNGRYINTIGKTELLDFIKLVSTQGKVIIEEIKTINTIKNEYQPKKRWA